MARPDDDSDAVGGVAAELGLAAEDAPDDVVAQRARLVAFLESAPEELAPWAARQLASIEGTDDAGPAAKAGPSRSRRKSRLTPLLLALVGAGIVIGVYLMGDAPSAQTATGVAATSPSAVALDEARVAELRSAIAADPNDVTAMRELGSLYYRAGDFTNAAEWQRRILALQPDDVDARLALGVVLFNTGDLPGARENWERAASLAPDQAEVHYNLGFLYLSLDPPELDRAKASWQRVIDLDPDSALAKTASAHLNRLSQTGGTPTPTPSASGK